ncbi:MAG: aldose epimerase family protein [Bacteroidota bacterium]
MKHLITTLALILMTTPLIAAPKITEKPYGNLADGTKITEYTLDNGKGMVVSVINWGGIITRIITPDKNGKPADIALGFTGLDGYLGNSPYFGAIIGRYGNRIGHAKFTLEGKTYTLPANDGQNTLHGGTKGFNKAVWDVTPFTKTNSCGLTLKYTSPDGEDGFPGTLKTTVMYTLTDKNELEFEFSATTDKATPVNLTQHSYFNLHGEGNGTILDHRLTIFADRYVAVDQTLIPTGKLPTVKGTAMDFLTPHVIGDRIDQVPGGYDHSYVLDRKNQSGMFHAVRLEDPTSGRRIDVYTMEPAVQFYSGNFLDGTITGENGKPYVKHGGLALETQHYPDSPNQPTFPSTILTPGKKYHTKTIYSFSVEK